MRNYLIAGIVLIALTNIVVLSGVAYNRSKPHINTIELSEREFRLPYAYGFASENSAKTVRLVTRMPNKLDVYETNTHGIFAGPLTEQQLARLGLVDLESPQSTEDGLFGQYYYTRYQVEVYLAVEFDGTAYQSALKTQEDEMRDLRKKMEANPDSVPEYQIKSAQRELDNERDTASRLFYVDAHVDSKKLIEKYKDQANIFVTKGQVSITVNKDAAYLASFANLLVEQIMLPSEIAHLMPQENLSDQKLLFTLNIGKRFEPWVSQLEIQK